MAGSVLGVWVAHSEGRAHFPSEDILARVSAQSLVPLRYVDERGEVTEAYPDNPNGSTRGIAGLCSEDGRHLALMPHPERAFLTWQWPWLPPEMRTLAASPWLRMFQNARSWCQGQTES
jgi:phosphoribosylformylglycinamidine synthase